MIEIAMYKNIKYGHGSIFQVGDYMENDSEFVRTSEIITVQIIDLPTADVVNAEIDGLKKVQGDLRAETELKLNAIDDKIQSLLAITHEVES